MHLPDGSRQDELPIRVRGGQWLGCRRRIRCRMGLCALAWLDRPARVANAAGAIVATRHACSTAMPTEEELAALLGSGVVPDRPADVGDLSPGSLAPCAGRASMH